MRLTGMCVLRIMSKGFGTSGVTLSGSVTRER
jgi:hypothetical protein